MSVWITRSAPDNLRTARELHALGQKPLMVPVLTTVARYQPPIGSIPEALVFTSVHAVRHFARHGLLSMVPVFAASGPVANAAASAGYATVISTSGDEKALPDLIGHVVPHGARILILCGDRTSDRLTAGLQERGFHVSRQAVYKLMLVQKHALEHVAHALNGVDAIVVHSRNGAERIAPMLRDAHWRGTLWCISQEASNAFADLPSVSVHTAAHPSEASLLDMIARLTPVRPDKARRRHPSVAALIREARSRSSSSGRKADNDNAHSPLRPDDDPEFPAA